MNQEISNNMLNLIGDKTNFIFVGEAGSGKSEVCLNFATYLKEVAGEKEVHFFDMDMTKPLFRSRDVCHKMEEQGIHFHYEQQFYDAPTMIGGVNHLLKDDNCYVVIDVGGDYIGARSLGGYAPKINKDNSIVYYVLNAYRPWSYDIEHIDGTLGKILGVSHIQLGKLHMVNNPNNGMTTTAQEFLDGSKRMSDMISEYMAVDFACVREELYEEVKDQSDVPLLPVHLYLTYEWLKDDLPGESGMPKPGRG